MVNHVVKPYPKDHGFLTMVNHGFFSRAVSDSRDIVENIR